MDLRGNLLLHEMAQLFKGTLINLISQRNYRVLVTKFSLLICCSGLHLGLFHLHAALREVARQPELLPAEVRRLLHVRHGKEEGERRGRVIKLYILRKML